MELQKLTSQETNLQRHEYKSMLVSSQLMLYSKKEQKSKKITLYFFLVLLLGISLFLYSVIEKFQDKNINFQDRMAFGNQILAKQQEKSQLDLSMNQINQKRNKKYLQQEQRYQQQKKQKIPDSNLSIIQLPPRTKLGQSKTPEYEFQIWQFMSNINNFTQIQKSNKNCVFINSINGVSKNTIQTIRNLLNLNNLAVFLLLSANDFKSEYLIQKKLDLIKKQSKKLILDADFTFGKQLKTICSKLAYLFGNFVLDHQMIKNIGIQIQNLRPSHLFFTSRYYINSCNRSQLGKLDDLSLKDLSNVQPENFNNYLYIFETQFFDIITPVNFVFYAKYTFEQALLIPILVIYQSGKKFYTNIKVFHSFTVSFVNFKQFSLKSNNKEKNSFCFISYPNNPYRIEEQNLFQYLESIKIQQENLKQKQNQISRVSIIIYLPYLFQQTSQLYKVSKQLTSISNRYKDVRIKLRIRKQKAVSSYAVYDGVYTYCPKQSLIVSSRHNIRFKKELIQQVLNYFSEKYHYYVFNIEKQNSDIIKLQGNYSFQQQFTTNKWKIYDQKLQFVQVFKSDFLKTGIFFYLKNQQIDFYQTEEAFVVHMMKMTQLSFGYINKTLARVLDRKYTQTQLKQIKYIKTYGKLEPLPNNQLIPYEYNCLENNFLRRNAPKIIPPNIHQIWLGQGKISRVRMVLRNSLISNNRNFTHYLWRNNNLTKSSAPITYPLIQRVLQHHKYFKTSLYAMAADLFRAELLVNYGGIYIDFKFEGLKPLDNFLKYENLFNDFDIGKIRYGSPKSIGNGIMGAIRNNYYLKTFLTELVKQENFNFKITIPFSTGGYVHRYSMTNRQVFTSIGYGYHFFFARPKEPIVNQCGGVDKKFDKDQQVFSINFYKSQKPIKIGIPCKQYPQSYLIIYKPLSQTWIAPKKDFN